MGNINILKAGYHGKVGESYGVAKKGLYIIKANPFSHTPHNRTQTAAKNAFTGLNKIAARVVKSMWNYLQLSDKTMYKNNALCRAWRAAIQDHSFTLEKLKLVISQDEQLQITERAFDPSNFSFAYAVGNPTETELQDEQIIYAAIVTDKFQTKADIKGQGVSVLLSSVFDYVDFAYFQVWAFKAVPKNRKWYLKGLSISDPVFVIIVNGVFFMSRWRWDIKPRVANGVLYLSETDCTITNGRLILQ